MFKLNDKTAQLMVQCMNLSMAASQNMAHLLEKVNRAVDLLGNPSVGPTASTGGVDLLRVDLKYNFKRNNNTLVLTTAVRANSSGNGYHVVSEKSVTGTSVTARLREKVAEASLEDLADLLAHETGRSSSSNW